MGSYRNSDTGCVIDIDDDLVALIGAGWVKAGGGKPQPAPSSAPAPEPADDHDETADAGDGPPPKSGKGSSDSNWTAYARSQGVEVTDDMSRKDVIAACEAAGVRIS